MTAEYEHPSANRTSKRAALQALVDRGATEGERAAAARQLAELDAKRVEAPDVDAIMNGAQSGRLYREPPSRPPQRVRDPFGLDGIHDAEEHAGKIGTLVVWRDAHVSAVLMSNHSSVRIRVPDGSVHVARRSSGTVHDTDQRRWGVLYRAKDLRPA